MLTLSELFLVGAVIIVVIVMLDEFSEAYDEWRDDDDEY
jgi:hypothetical protein